MEEDIILRDQPAQQYALVENTEGHQTIPAKIVPMGALLVSDLCQLSAIPANNTQEHSTTWFTELPTASRHVLMASTKTQPVISA